ncbi:hypothetical protein [Persephonella sp.]
MNEWKYFLRELEDKFSEPQKIGIYIDFENLYYGLLEFLYGEDNFDTPIEK